MGIYIKSYFGIDDLHLGKEAFVSATDQLNEPEYEVLIDIRSMRRLSKVLKYGMYSSLEVLRQADNINPDGIISGTGLGCTSDTMAFLNNMIQREEHLLTPTAFIQSTHNTLSGSLGILLKNHGYNMTWSHRDLSFYSALEDGCRRLEAGKGNNYLIVGADEMPESVEDIIRKIDHCGDRDWSEGAAAFMIGTDAGDSDPEISDHGIVVKDKFSYYLNNINIDDTLIINCNSYIGEIDEKYRKIDLTVIKPKSFIDDAIGLHLACRILKEEDSKFKNVICIGGSKEQISFVHVKIS